MTTCPFGGIDDLADDAPDGFDAATAAKGDDRAAINQTDQRDDPLLLQCATGNEDGTLLYGVTAAALPPTELKDYIGRTLTSATAEFEDTSSFRGGTLLPFCTKPDEGAEVKPICATAWYDKELMAAIFATGDGLVDRPDDGVDQGRPRRRRHRTRRRRIRTRSRSPRPSASTSTRRRRATNLDALIAAADVTDPDDAATQDQCFVADMATRARDRPRRLRSRRRRRSGPVRLDQPAGRRRRPAVRRVHPVRGRRRQPGRRVRRRSKPPDDFEAYVKRSAQTDDVTFDDTVGVPRRHACHPYCGTSSNGSTFCESDWVSDDIQVGIFSVFDGVTSRRRHHAG